MVKEYFLGNVKGDTGEKGDKGDKGDPGKDGRDGLDGLPGKDGIIGNINPNIINFKVDTWETGGYDENGLSIINTKNIRTIIPITIKKGRIYTLSDESLYVSSLSKINIYEWDNDVFIGIKTINRLGTLSFTAEGNKLFIEIVPMSGFTLIKEFLLYDDFRLIFKLENGDRTPIIKAIHDLERRIDNLK